MKIHWKHLLIVPAICGAISCQAVQINWSSACDFAEASLRVRNDSSDQFDSVWLDVTLNEAAATRMERVTRDSLHQKMSLILNGKLISTATIQSVIGAKMQIALPRRLALSLMPTLLAKPKGTCKAGV